MTADVLCVVRQVTRDRGRPARTPTARVSGAVGGRIRESRGLRDAFRLVVDLQRDLLQLVGVLFAVVGAEQQVEAAGQGDANVGLGPAAVTTIRSVEGGFDDQGVTDDWPRFPAIGWIPLSSPFDLAPECAA